MHASTPTHTRPPPFVRPQQRDHNYVGPALPPVDSFQKQEQSQRTPPNQIAAYRRRNACASPLNALEKNNHTGKHSPCPTSIQKFRFRRSKPPKQKTHKTKQHTSIKSNRTRELRLDFSYHIIRLYFISHFHPIKHPALSWHRKCAQHISKDPSV